MSLKTKNKVDPAFSMSSLTDIVFLLLIFFMLTSTLVSPNALNLLLPNSDNQEAVKTSLSISITEDLKYHVGDNEVQLSQIRGILTSALDPINENTVVLNSDKTVPLQHVVAVMDIVNDLKFKMILATSPEK